MLSLSPDADLPHKITSQDRQPPLLRLRGLSKVYGQLTAVQPLDLDIHARDFVAMLGPSGCGKTTLLRMIGGFVAPTTGTIEIADVDVTALGPERRPTNMVFQCYGLFPHMNVSQNIGYGLRLQKMPKGEIDARVGEAIALVQLADLATRGVDQLSGGQQQRVALARALVMRPKVLLLDEPLAALDLKLRQAMQEELRRIHHEIGGTFVFVTHDQSEALGLANRIAVMRDGRLEQVGTAQEIYASPKTRFVSTFIGEANLLPGRRSNGTVTLAAGPKFSEAGADGDISVVVRPENLFALALEETAEMILEGTVRDVVYLGSHVKYKVAVRGGSEMIVHARPEALRVKELGETMRIGWQRRNHRIVDA
jgi:ABC-type Fe3+/spermidine/putrescine transport system ATPase subunit